MAQVQDVYTANLENSNFGDQLSDAFIGTNNVALKNVMNQYRTAKAMTINKFGWNKEGMLAAGINPLMNTQGLNGVSSGVPSGMENRPTIGTRIINRALKVMGDNFDYDTNKQQKFDNSLKVVNALI